MSGCQENWAEEHSYEAEGKNAAKKSEEAEQHGQANGKEHWDSSSGVAGRVSRSGSFQV
jgi:hypothetical protein